MHGVAGAAVFAGGTMLAERGLMGSSAGTWGGVAEGTAGGAAIGFTMGGPRGAAIGAGVGLGIGLGEKALGVKSLQQTAHAAVRYRPGDGGAVVKLRAHPAIRQHAVAGIDGGVIRCQAISSNPHPTG